MLSLVIPAGKLTQSETKMSRGGGGGGGVGTTLGSRALLVIIVLVCGSNGPTFNSRSAFLHRQVYKYYVGGNPEID